MYEFVIFSDFFSVWAEWVHKRTLPRNYRIVKCDIVKLSQS